MKLALLQTICETPGWQPPVGGAPTSVSVKLYELVQEGLIVKHLNGYEATAEALDLLPRLTEDEDGNLVRSEPESEPSKPPLQAPTLDWNVPQRAVVFLRAGSEGHHRVEGWALLGGPWLFLFDDAKLAWETWPERRVVKVEWVTDA